MTDKSGLPGVNVDEGRVEDFLAGIYGANKHGNKRALEWGALLVAANAVARHVSPKKKKKRGKK